MKRYEKEVEQAVSYFNEGYNCSQSVLLAFSSHYQLSDELALRLSSSFGGGIGRMRLTCGAACGLFLLAGLENGSTDSKDRAAKGTNYELVQALAQEFVRRNGALECSELLGIASPKRDEPQPEERTKHYYKKRPCVQIVEEAARIWAEYRTCQEAQPIESDANEEKKG